VYLLRMTSSGQCGAWRAAATGVQGAAGCNAEGSGLAIEPERSAGNVAE